MYGSDHTALFLRVRLCKLRPECEAEALTAYAVINAGGWDKGGSVASISAVEAPVWTSSSA